MDGLQVRWLLVPYRFDVTAVFAGYIAATRTAIL